MIELEEKIIAKRDIYSGLIFDVCQYDVSLPNGNESKRDVVVNPNACAVVAVDDENYVYAVEQYRITAKRVMLEIPAGKMDPGEDHLTCATRELKEETGIIAGKMRYLFGIRVSPGFSTEIIHIYLATELTRGQAEPDEDEFLNIRRIKLDEFVNMALTGKLKDAKPVSGILATQDIFEIEG